MQISAALTLIVALLGSAVVAQPPPPTVPNCLPNDLPCFMTQAQYTILGTVVGNNANTPPGSAQNYNATIAVQCIYASFGNNRGQGGFVGQQITVTGFGNPNQKCPNNMGADAIPNNSSIFFIYVASSVPQGGLPIFTVFNPCGGGIPYSPQNLQTLANSLAKFPQNAIAGAPNCALPAPEATATAPAGGATQTPGGNPLALPGSAGYSAVPQWTLFGGIATIALAAMTALF
ncbi:uncharacterized protein SPPG_05392 [Spizellomyces punctatus DAOM BR117]|uniref:Uncharacterized protein n=1 Tax=Spizellomyces punctatus (strain DAOM BR117) TaxID=645134 RepID=A0A0L0HEG6_SPIPD|nr:uncharacterized protein SPPG_05392 [Spizellomyces punctatus DAOM BR117]KNC99133.1 hypothetical protein SPPG_05392 [Spizellomyces punctatus DAOM BR117]|eukprot:XP_016607173.1 hypothetical protein SPPG_05392 [Spizellomyces punctatus DAOM BR117]